MPLSTNCHLLSSDVHFGHSMRQVDDGSDFAVDILVVREEGMRVPVEQDVHLLDRDGHAVYRVRA